MSNVNVSFNQMETCKIKKAFLSNYFSFEHMYVSLFTARLKTGNAKHCLRIFTNLTPTQQKRTNQNPHTPPVTVKVGTRPNGRTRLHQASWNPIDNILRNSYVEKFARRPMMELKNVQVIDYLSWIFSLSFSRIRFDLNP